MEICWQSENGLEWKLVLFPRDDVFTPVVKTMSYYFKEKDNFVSTIHLI